MGRSNSNSNYPCNLDKYCNNITNQYLFLASIYSAIISEEIEDDEALGILGTFLIVLGEEISLASELRIFVNLNFKMRIMKKNKLKMYLTDAVLKVS